MSNNLFNPIESAKSQVREIVLNALGRLTAEGKIPAELLPAFTVEIPNDISHGDFSCNAALVSAKTLKQNPRAIAQMIVSKGKKLYFYTRYSEEKHRNDIEIDFLLSNESKTNFRVFPIEVKSSKNYSTTSLGKFKEMFGKKIAEQYIIHPKNLAVEGNVIKIPPYMFPIAF